LTVPRFFAPFSAAHVCFLLSFSDALSPRISIYFSFTTDFYEEFEDEDDGTGLTGKQVRSEKDGRV
jgi:hypothetical protein